MIFLMPLYFIIALVIIYKLMKKYPSKHKIGQFLLLSFLFYLPVGWDVILGRAYFNYLCHKDGGIHIYQTVELGDEYWDEDGSPRFYSGGRGAFDSSLFDGGYVLEMSDDRYSRKRPFRTIQSTLRVVDVKTDKVLGEWIKYETLGGWIMNTAQPFFVRGVRCHSYDDTPDNPIARGIGNPTHKKFISYIFIKKDTKFSGEEQ